MAVRPVTYGRDRCRGVRLSEAVFLELGGADRETLVVQFLVKHWTLLRPCVC
jgi:hypothetical protein